ncbi:unnamed protein product [Nesidiocoris tenuis]|uniref:Uncharacterized protein n=1 Tax=Nesidiocoris tenuis TaxID=355587 RepID=A0A6H5HD62_9HEMI|nr:unnamed protein product [Nesidiocoris tenuis]
MKRRPAEEKRIDVMKLLTSADLREKFVLEVAGALWEGRPRGRRANVRAGSLGGAERGGRKQI